MAKLAKEECFMEQNELNNIYCDVGKHALVSKTPSGTANLLSGYSTLRRGADAGVTPYQMKAMYPDLNKFSDIEISGFINIASGMVEGTIFIPILKFEHPFRDKKTDRVADAKKRSRKDDHLVQ